MGTATAPVEARGLQGYLAMGRASAAGVGNGLSNGHEQWPWQWPWPGEAMVMSQEPLAMSHEPAP